LVADLPFRTQLFEGVGTEWVIVFANGRVGEANPAADGLVIRLDTKIGEPVFRTTKPLRDNCVGVAVPEIRPLDTHHRRDRHRQRILAGSKRA